MTWKYEGSKQLYHGRVTMGNLRQITQTKFDSMIPRKYLKNLMVLLLYWLRSLK